MVFGLRLVVLICFSICIIIVLLIILLFRYYKNLIKLNYLVINVLWCFNDKMINDVIIVYVLRYVGVIDFSLRIEVLMIVIFRYL